MDLDIDKAYILGRNFDKYGRFIFWSPLAKYDSNIVFDASLSLPGNSGYEIIPANEIWKRQTTKFIPLSYVSDLESNWKLNTLIDDYKLLNSLNTNFESSNNWIYLKTKYLVFTDINEQTKLAILLKIMAALIKEVNNTKDFSISEKFKNDDIISEIVDKINLHNLYISSYQKEAQQNLNVTRMLEINKDARNEIAAYSAIDDAMALFLDPIKEKSTEYLMAIDNGVSIALGTAENATGKDDVGVAANSMKVYMTTLLYLNKYFKDTPPASIEKLLTNKKFKLNKIVLNYKGRLTDEVVEAHIVPTIADVLVPKEAIDLYNNFMAETFKNEWEEGYRIQIPSDDASLSLSSIVSLATDNAKTLALSKINAGIELLCMHTYLTSLGFSPEAIVLFTTGEAFKKFASLIGDSVFEGQDGHLKYSTWVLFESWCKLNHKLREYQQIKNLYYNAQEFKNFASILKINQGVKNSEDSINILFNFLNALRSQIDIYNQNPRNQLITADGFTNVEELVSLILINSGFFNVITLDSKAQSIVCSIDLNSQFFKSLVNKINKINEELQALQIDLTQSIDVTLYFNNEAYRNAITNAYDIIKSTVNIYDVLNETPHFYAMMHKYSDTIDQLCAMLAESRFAYKIAQKLYNPKLISNKKKYFGEEDGGKAIDAYYTPKFFTKLLISSAIKLFNEVKLFNFIKTLPEFSISIQGFDKIKINFLTDEGIKLFCLFMNNILIPILLFLDLSHNITDSNKFLQSLTKNLKMEDEGKPFYGLGIKLNILRNSDLHDQNLLYLIENDFNKVADLYISEALKDYIIPNTVIDPFLENVKVGELFWLYNKIMRHIAPQIESYDGLFAKFELIPNNLLDQFEQYEKRLDSGEEELNIDEFTLLAGLFRLSIRKTKGVIEFGKEHDPIKLYWTDSSKQKQCKYFITAPEQIEINNEKFFKPDVLIESIKTGLLEVNPKEKCN